MFVVDVTLREWQSGLSEIAHDLWVCHYKAWYQEHPRKTSEWIDKAWKLYLASEKGGKQAYADYVDAMLNEWVHKAFLDPQIATYGDCGTSSFGGRAYIEQKIEAEHKLLLQQMFAKKVMPEIGERAWMRTLRAQVKEAETHLMPRLNRTVTLEITAYGYPAGTIATMPLPAGGEWKAKLRDDGTRKAKITRFAILKAGFPDTVRIDGPNGPEERKLILTEDRLVAMFGTPITPVVTRYSLTEGAGSCTIKRIHDDGSVNEEQTADSRHPDKDVDFAILGNGSWVFGQYSLGSGWQVASPGVGQGENISFGAPYFDRISGLHGCSVGFLQDDKLAAGRCRITRYDEKRVSATTRIQRSCTADATIELSGIFASVISGKMTYYPMDGAEGQMILQVLKSSMSKGLVGGMPAIPDAPMFPGASALPPIPGVNK